MNAILHAGYPLPWLPNSEDHPWPLLPIGNRHWLEFWIECCLHLKISDITILLAEGAYAIEQWAGEGERWGIHIRYRLLKENMHPDVMARRIAAVGGHDDGLLYLREPFFPRRHEQEARPLAPGELIRFLNGEREMGFCTANPDALAAFAAGTPLHTFPTLPPETLGFTPLLLDTPRAYHDLNMCMVRGEINRYATPGYGSLDGSHMGYNVIFPASAALTAPVMIGNDCRFLPLCAVGPHAVIGNHVVADTQSELADCVVLDGTYIGRNLEIKNKIIVGPMLIDPESGISVKLEDPLLLDRVGNGLTLVDFLRMAAGRLPALIWWLVMLPVFVLLYGLIRLTGRGTFSNRMSLDRRDQPIALPYFSGRPDCGLVSLFNALCLDRWPMVWAVLRGRLYLCGHEPIHVRREPELREKLPIHMPAAFTEDLLLSAPPPPLIRLLNILYYVHTRNAFTDITLLLRCLLGRIFQSCTLPGQTDGTHD